MEIGGGIELADKITAEFGFVIIDNDRIHVIDIKTQRETKKNNEYQRNRESQVKTAGIPDQMIKFLADYGFDSYRIQALVLFIRAMKASFKSASGLPGQAPVIISAGLPVATMLPALIITILSQKRASSM